MQKKPNSFYAASDPTDVARVEDRTFICSVREQDAGPTNNWMDPLEMKSIMTELYRGCMRVHTTRSWARAVVAMIASIDPARGR